MAINLANLGLAARRQIVEQLIAQKAKPQSGMSTPITAASFDSKGEENFYNSVVLPLLCCGRLERCELHEEYELYPESTYCGFKLPRAVFSPDFVLLYQNGTVEVIEIKSKFTKKQSRDYTLRRRLFIDKYCRPRGWLWREVVTDKEGSCE